MRHSAVLLVLLSLIPIALPAAPEKELFPGSDLAGWEFVTVPAVDIKDVCTVKPDGVIAVSGKPVGFLATTGSHRDFRLHAEWRWPGKPGNGGVLVNISPGPKDHEWPLCLQMQLKNGNAGDLIPMAGATFAEPLTSAPGTSPSIKARTAADSEKPAGDWNICDITCRGGTIEISVNGVPQNKVTHANPAAGRVGFQLEGVPFELRHVTVTPLD